MPTSEIIEQDTVKRLCPEEFEEFLAACRQGDQIYDEEEWEDDDYYLGEVARDYLMFDSPCPPKIKMAWDALVARFEQETRPRRSKGNPAPKGLKLFAGYFDPEFNEGAEGIYFEAEGVYELSPAGRKLRRLIRG